MEPFKGTNKGGGGAIMRRTFPDGRMYEGQLIKGKMEGEGILIEPNGTRYQGSFVGNKPHGKGSQTWDDGRRFEGVFKDGHAHIGILTSKDGSIYEGEFCGNQPSGHGVKMWEDGARYEGQFQDGKMNGEGSYAWPDGTHHVGHFDDDTAEGQGIYTCADGRVYRGLFRGGEIVQGVCTWGDGRKYDGVFSGGKATGKGMKVYPDGTVHKGNFNDCVIFGKGVELRPDGTMSEGEFEEGKIVAGTTVWPDGRRYEGPFQHTRPHGNGTLAFPDGRRYEGHFNDAKFEGIGVFYFPDGRCYEGIFKEGDLESNEVFVSLDGKWSGYGKAAKDVARMNKTKTQHGNDHADATLKETKRSSQYDATKNNIGANTVELFGEGASKVGPARGVTQAPGAIASTPKVSSVFSPRPDLQDTSIVDTSTSRNVARDPCSNIFGKDSSGSEINSRTTKTCDIFHGKPTPLSDDRRSVYSVDSEYETSNSKAALAQPFRSKKQMDPENQKLGQRKSLREVKGFKADRRKSLHQDKETVGRTQEDATFSCWGRKTWSDGEKYEEMRDGVLEGSDVLTWKDARGSEGPSKDKRMHGSGVLRKGHYKDGWLGISARHERFLGDLSIVSHMFSPLP